MKYVFVLILVLSSIVNADSFIQNSNSREHLLLDGQWRTIVDPFDVGDKRKFFENKQASKPSELLEYNFKVADTLSVPGDWNTQKPELFFYEGTVWYQKEFHVNPKNNKKYALFFDGVNYKAEVYINSEYLGLHEGGFTPFQFDVTEKLKQGSNSLVVRVNNRREPDRVPTMNTDWWNYGGITRSVKLIELDETFIEDYRFTYVSRKNKGIEFEVTLGGNIKQPSKGRLKIPELNINREINFNGSSAQFFIPATPELWTPQNPKLYTVEISYGEAAVKDEIGFRTIEVSGTDILLNGESIFLKGVAIHEEKPSGAGRAWSLDDYKTLLEWAKELGCNYVRLAHYPHGEKMLQLADKMGLLVWAEIPVYWDIKFDSEEVYKNAERQYSEMLRRDKNRASVILWSVANETPNEKKRTKFLSRLVKKVKKLDSSRLVTAALNTQSTTKNGRRISDSFAKYVDVIGINTYCGWYEDEAETCAKYTWVSDYDKPIIISEFGAGALQGNHGSINSIYTEEFQVNVFKNNLVMMDNMKDLRGVSPWVLKDFMSPRRPLKNIQDYWNRKGLRSERGVKKEVWNVMKDWYSTK